MLQSVDIKEWAKDFVRYANQMKEQEIAAKTTGERQEEAEGYILEDLANLSRLVSMFQQDIKAAIETLNKKHKV